MPPGRSDYERDEESAVFGLNIDPSVDERDLAVELAAVADGSGLDFIACQDHPYHRRHLDTWTLLTVLTTTTSRVAVMPNVANLPLRTPAIVANSAATLAVLADGRVELGIGAGAQWDAIVAYGGERREPGAAVDAFEEAVRVIRALWGEQGETAEVDGTYYSLAGARPGPLPDEPIRLWFGAYGPRMLGLTGREADGWSPTNRYAPPAAIPDMQDTIDDAARAADREPSAVRRNYNLMGRIDAEADPEEGETLVGPPSYWCDVLARYHDELRFDTFTFWPTGSDVREQARLYAHEVVPRVRERLGEVDDEPGGYL